MIKGESNAAAQPLFSSLKGLNQSILSLN